MKKKSRQETDLEQAMRLRVQRARESKGKSSFPREREPETKSATLKPAAEPKRFAARGTESKRFAAGGRDRSPEPRRFSSAPRERDGEPKRFAPSARVGTLRIQARGFGFVTLEDGSGDVFIAPGELLGALHGDKVAISVRPSDRGFEGTVVAVLVRGMKHVAGLMQQTQDGLFIVPNDARLPRLVRIVGDVPGDAVPGLEVVGEITKFPEDGSPPSARIVRVLGIEGAAEVEVAKIKLREGILEEFPEPALEAAQAFGGRVSPKERKGRIDLRHLDLVTIDPITARDHDDAIYIARHETGGYRVVVAIADVSHYVQEGSPIDAEAIARSTSIYLPDRAIPMLPPELSSDLASLVAHKDRLTLAIDMEVAANGAVRTYRFLEGVMRCKAGLTYEGVAQALGLTENGRVERPAVQLLPMLEVLRELAMILRARRMKRGSLDFDLPEPFVELDKETGEPKNVTRSRKDPGVRKAYQMVEEMMLLANETVAADLAQRKVPAIYRVHGQPDADRLSQFAGLAQALGYNFDPEDAANPKEIAAFLQTLEDSPHKSSLSYLLLRSMQQATYDTVNIGHFGLAADHYLHFTSPIRRYPDLAVHRVVAKIARGEAIDVPGLERKLTEQAGNASKLERRAMLVEREVMDVYRCILIKDRIGEEFEATVSGIAAHGIYVTFDEPFVEALCHVSALGHEFYEIDKHGLKLVGRRSGASFGLGDRVMVRLESVNVAERSVLAAPVVYASTERMPSEGGFDRPVRREKKRAKWDAAASETKRTKWDAAAASETKRPKWDAAVAAGASKRPKWDAAVAEGAKTKRPKWDEAVAAGGRKRPKWDAAVAAGERKAPAAAVDPRVEERKRERRRERRVQDERKLAKRKRR